MIESIPVKPILPKYYETRRTTYNMFIDEESLMFSLRRGYKIKYFLLFFLGLVLLFISCFYFNKLNGASKYVLLILGLGFSLGISYKYFKLKKFHVFDKDEMEYRTSKNKRLNSLLTLNNIECVQLLFKEIVEKHSVGKERFNAYEVNLVLKDGSRLNVLNYCDKEPIQQQAQELSDFLGVPLWSSLDDNP